MTGLRTRKPTGQVAFPFILLEGEEKAGKSYAAYRLSASPRIGRTFVFDLGEGTADEYAELGPYEVVEHNGTYSDLVGQMRLAAAEPALEGRPNVIVLDDGTVLWDLLKDWISARARASKKGQETLRADPDAEIDIAMNLWNDAKDRWYDVLNLLRTFPGVGIMIAKGKEVSAVENGRPVQVNGRTVKEWKVDVEKSTGFAASAWVRMTRPHVATLIGTRSLHVEVLGAGLALPPENPLEHLVFEVLGAGPGGFVKDQRTNPVLGLEKPQAKQRLLHLIEDAGYDTPRAKIMAADLWKTTGDPDELSEEQWAILEEVARVRLEANPPHGKPPESPQEGSPPPTPSEQAESAENEPPAAGTDDVVGRIIDQVGRMGEVGLISAMHDAGLPAGGDRPTRQQRYAAWLVEQATGEKVGA